MLRRSLLRGIGRSACAIGAGTWLHPSWAAEEAFSSSHITIGSSLALSGTLGNAGVEHTNGIKAAFAAANRSGGVLGRELRLLSKDDAYSAPRTAANVKQMIDDNAAFALMSVMGTPNTAAILPMVEKAGVPLLGPITGATSLRSAEHRFVFHLRPSYADEVTRLVQQLVEMGISNLSVVYLDNAFGKEVLGNVQQTLKSAKLTATGAFALAVDGSNAAQVAQQTLDSKPGAVFMGTTGAASTEFVMALRAKSLNLPVIGLSVTFTERLRLGKLLTGLAVAQVFPSEHATKYAAVRKYLASLEAIKLSNPGGLGLESWLNAQLLMEGLRRAGRDLTRDKLRSALAGIRSFEIGEIVVSFNPTGPYVGTSTVKLGIFGPDGFPRA